MSPCLMHKDHQIRKKLGDRLDLEDATQERWILNKSVQPITNVDILLHNAVILDETVDLSGAAGTWQTILTVPINKKIRLTMLHKPGTLASSGVQITDGTNQCRLTSTNTNEGTSIIDAPMETGWLLQVYNTGNGGDNVRTFGALYYIEDTY